MRTLPLLLAAALALPAAALALPAAAPKPTPDAQLEKLLAGRVAGRPVPCIGLPRSDSPQIIPGRALVYRDGARLYVNRPKAGAERLDDRDLLVTRVNGGQLCSNDMIQRYDRIAPGPRGFVVLGDFVPYTRAKPGA